MEPVKQDLNFKMKPCVVVLEKMDKNDCSDSDELPSLPFIVSSNRRKKKIKKSSKELLKDHQNLVQNIKGDTESNVHIQETMRRLETIEIVTTDDRSSETPDPAPCEENNELKIFSIKNSLLFFNSRDVTPAQCGYNSRCHDSFPVHGFEQKMLSFKRVEFEHVISSFIYSAKECSILDCKSFITFLLRTLSVHADLSCVVLCYKTIVCLLDNHPESSFLTFSSAEIFMLLFNYGVDFDSFNLLSKWTDIKQNFEVPYPLKNCTGIPERWFCNLKFILKALTKIVSTCSFKETDIERIIIFLLWMNKDSSLIKENLITTVRNCVYKCLENIKEDKWKITVCNITNSVMSMVETSSVPEKWMNIYNMAESIPNRRSRSVELKKIICFKSLKFLIFGSNEDLEENCIEFHINDVHSLIKKLSEVKLDLLGHALKFFDNCAKHLNASKEEYIDLCASLKQCEVSLSSKAQDEKTYFLKIYSKLRLFCGQKAVYDLLNIKSEKDYNQGDNDRNNPCSSEMNNERNSFTPGISEDSESYCANQSDNTNSSSSDANNVQIKSEYGAESDVPETASSLKMLIRKKRSSRSSSGNSLVSSVLSNIKCESEDLSRQSSEFECQLLDDEVGSVAVQDSAIDVEYPESNLILSDFTVEYPEEISDILKDEPEAFTQMPMSFEIEKMNIVDNEEQIEKSPSTLENYTNQNLVEDDLSPLPEIWEVKSIAFCNMDIPDLANEIANDDIHKVINQSSSIEISCTENNYGMPVLCDMSEPEIISYGGSALNNTSSHEESITVQLNKGASSHSTCTENLLDTEEDVVIIEETVSTKKLSQTSLIEENIPSPIQRYTKALPELSITPVKSVPSLSVDCKNVSVNNEDIVIIEEKSPVKKTNNVMVFLEKISSPDKSSLLPKNDARDRDKIPIQENTISNEEVSKSPVKSQETNSDGDDIVLVDVIMNDQKVVISHENQSSIIGDDNVVSLNNEPVSNISHLQSDSPNHQCHEHSGLKQVEIKKNCEEVLESVLDCVNTSFKDCADVMQTTPNSFNKYLISDDMKLHSTEKPISEFEIKIGSTIGFEKSDLETYQNNLNEPNESSAVFQTVANTAENFTNKIFNNESVANASHLLNLSDVSKRNRILSINNDKSNENSIEIDVNDLTDKICHTVENMTDEVINSSSQNFSYDLQGDNNIVIFQIDNRSLEASLKVAQPDNSDFTVAIENSLHIPVMISAVESDSTSQIHESESVISSSFPCSVSDKSDSRVTDIILAENQNVNKLADVVVDINDKVCEVFDTSQNNVSEAIKGQNITKKSVLNKSSSKALDKSETKCLNKLTTITPVLKAKAKIHTVPQVDLSKKSTFQNDENRRDFGNNAQKSKIPFESNKLSIYKNEVLKPNNSKILLDALMKSNQKKRGVPVNNVARKSLVHKHEEEHTETAQRKVSHRRNTSCSVSPSSSIQKKRSWSSISENREGGSPRKTPKKYSPLKSPLGSKYNQKSPQKKFDFSIQMRQKYKCFNKASVLSRTGLNLTNVLRKRITSSSSSMCHSNNASDRDSDDSDIIELYRDPKRCADKDCLIVYESEEIVILDSD